MKYLNQLKKLIGEELTVLEADNKILNILEINSYTDSILNGDNIYYAFGNSSNTYRKDESDEIIEYNVCFSLVEENEYKESIIIKIEDIEIL